MQKLMLAYINESSKRANFLFYDEVYISDFLIYYSNTSLSINDRTSTISFADSKEARTTKRRKIEWNKKRD